LKKTVRNVSIALIIIAAIAFLVVPKILSEKNKTAGDGRQGQQDQTIAVDAYVVKYQNLDNEIATVGTIVANEEVEIRSELPRKITGIYFKEGSFVPKGKVLFKLDDSDLLAQLRKLELDEQLQMKQAEREQQLLEKGLLTSEEYDIRQTNIEKIRADIEIIKISIDKTDITAPFSGITGFRNVSDGSFVNNTVVLTTVKDIRKVKVDFSIPEKYISEFSKGQQITFKVEGYEDEFKGTVVSFDPQLNENTRSIVLRALADNSGSKLLPGSFVKVNLQLSEISNALMIPTEAVVPQQKGQSVFVINSGIAIQKDVEIGNRTEKDVIITSGINQGDTVITTNILRLKNNGKVKVANIF
jgi:membrane fusion protein (multidrug efflux system)